MPPAFTPRPTDAPDRALRALLSDIVARCEVFEVIAERVAHLEGTARDEWALTVRATGELVRRLDRLSGQIAALESLPTRLGAVEEEVRRLDQDRLDHGLAGLEEQVEYMRVRLESLASTGSRLKALERGNERVGAIAEVVDDIGRRTTRLADQLSALDGVPDRLASLERSQHHRPPPAVPPALEEEVGRLGKRLAALESSPERIAALEASSASLPQVRALEKVVAGMIDVVKHLSDDLKSLKEHPGLTAATEPIKAPEQPALAADVNKTMKALASRIDRLTTQAAVVKDVPERVTLLERSLGGDGKGPQEVLAHLSARTEALARGLGAAIDMIDQLTHQMTTLERAVMD